MEYILTQEDIDRFGLTDAIAGDIATPADLAMMGKYTAPFAPQEERAGALSVPMPSIEAQRAAPVTQVSADLPYDPSAILPPEVPVEQQVAGTTAAITPAAPAAAAPAMGGMDAMAAMGLLSDPVQQDPFENLSRSQRTMLGFAALKDAGMALQGKEGTAVKNVMADITERADMERKRQAAILRQQMLGQVLGDSSLAGQAATTPDAIRAQIDKLTNLGMVNPNLAPAIANRIKVLQDEAERLTKQTTQATAQMSGLAAVDALLTAPNLGAITGFEGTVNEFFSQYGMAPEFSNLTSYINQLQGLNFLEAYQQLKGGGPITDIEGKQATQARTRLEDSLKGRPEDLRVALLEVRKLFQDALDKNPTYTGAGDYSEAEKAALEAARKARGN